MTSVSHLLPSGLRYHLKWNVFLAHLLCAMLLAISCYGFWKFLQIPTAERLMEREELFYLISLVIIPLALFVFLSVTTAQRLEHQRLSASYQSRLDHMQARLNTQEDFMHSVTDRNPESIVIFDKNNHYWFANLSAAKRLSQNVNDMIGKPTAKVLGYEQAYKVEKRLNEVRMSGKPIETLEQIKGEQGQIRFIQTHFEIVAPFGNFSGGVMVREEDVTNLIVERERRETMLRQVMRTLIAVVDRRDPYAAGHSARVGQLSRVIAEEMMLDEKGIEATEVAGSLMNFGKVLVPRAILTKATALTPEELQRVRESILTSADILSIIEFSGPVVPTLRQVMERFDGSGVPQGLKGDQILMTARIVMVANAYVALASPRAHRPSLSPKEAMENLMRDADKLYDRRVVIALANCIENRGDKLEWLSPAKTA
ncbi:MAG: HD domain-containing phosphohydrolase [Alphaproteobacteria bacterium]|nr:HD domain-containing phosphohydrolase [Alphaproteobacteria bacterium]